MKNKFGGYLFELLLLLAKILNFSSGFISGIWLMFLGQWKMLVMGLIVAFVMPIIYSILGMLSIGLAPVVTKLIEKKKKTGIILGMAASIYEKFLLFIWLVYVFNLFVVDGYSSGIFIVPLLLWGYTVVLSPLNYMGQHEGSNVGMGTTFGILATMISFIVLSLSWVLGLPLIVTYSIPLLIYVVAAVLPVLTLIDGHFDKKEAVLS